MTASRAINSTGYVSKEVRARVLKAAEKLGYRANFVARSLKQQRLHAVGVMLPDIANPFSAELVAGMQTVLQAHGYTTFLATSNRSVQQEKEGLVAFAHHRLDGILVATRGTQMGNEMILELTNQGIPVCTVGRPIEDADIDCVTADHWNGAYQAVAHMARLGHKRIGFVGIAPEDAHLLRRYKGYADALAAHGIPVRDELVVGPASGPAFAVQEDGHAGMMELAGLKRPPTAIFARNDYTAIGALHAAHELGLKVPEDIAIAGFDNIPLSAFTLPPLTTVEQPIGEQGRRAAQFLLDRIEGRVKGQRREVTLECRLIVRASTDPGMGARKRKSSH